MRQKQKWDEIIGWILWTASLCMLGISVFLCFSSDIWYDELFTMGLAGQSCGKLISITARDVHPPLYYLIVKLFLTLFGTAGGSIAARVAIAKLVSVLPFFLCILYALGKVRKHFGMLSAGLFSFLLVTMPQMADYTVEIRMYGYALFFIMAGMLHAYELAAESPGRRPQQKIQAESPGRRPQQKIQAESPGRKPQQEVQAESLISAEKRERWKSYVNWILLTVYALSACYTHYFACVAAVMIYVYLLAAFWKGHRLKEKIKPFLASGLCCAAGFLPWMLLAVTYQVGQVKENYWIQPLSLRTLGGCIKFLFWPSFDNGVWNGLLAAVIFLVYGVLAALLLWRLWRNDGKEKGENTGRDGFAAGCIGVLAGLIGFGFLASFLVRPIFVYRYMLPAMGLFWLAFALLFADLKNKKHLFFPILFILLITGCRNYCAFYGEEMWKRIQMEEAGKALEQIREEDIVLFNFAQAQGVISYYLNNETYLWYEEPEELIKEMYPKVHVLVEEGFSDEAGIAKIKALLKENGSIWFIGSGNSREEIIEKWKAAGIGADQKASALVERYWFNIYSIYIDDKWEKG